MADALFEVLVYQGTPYGHPLDGTVESLQRMSASDLARFHARHYQPSNCILAMVGDIRPVEACALAEKYLGDWKGSEPRRSSSFPSRPPAGRRIVVVDKPDAVQTEIRAGNRAARRNSSEFYALTVANQVLGGPSVNRLFRQLRSRRGLAYGASSEVQLRRQAGSWMAKTSTRTSETVAALRAVLEETGRFGNDPGSARDLRMARSYLIGHMALEFETSRDVAAQTLELLVHDLPLDAWQEYAARVDQVQASELSEVGRRYLAGGSEIVVLVGNAQQFEKDLRKLGPFEKIPLPELDLASPQLRRPRR
jgi:zinc protease